ncbi:MAG: hypothetical protein ACT4PV_01245 [Planctomycetaceae bacterium]
MKLALAALLFALAACGGINSPEDAAEATVDTMKDLNDVLDGITDKASLQAAKPKLEAIKKRMKELAKSTEKLRSETGDPKLSPETQKKVTEQLSRWMANGVRLASIEGAEETLSEVMGELGGDR